MGDTVWSRLAARAAQAPDAPALLEKRFGLWTTTTTAQLVARAAHTALALRREGVADGDVVALVLKPHGHRVVIELALQLIGAQVVGIPSKMPLPIVRHVLADAGVGVAVVQGQAAADGLLELVEHGHLPQLTRMLYVDPAGVQDYASPLLAPFPAVDDGASAPADLGDLVAAVDPSAPAARSYTSGTAGLPTPVVLTHAGVLAAATSAMEAFALTPEDRVLSFRALSDPVERGVTVIPALLSGAVLALPESRASVAQALAEVRPTSLHLTTRFLEELATDVRLRMQEARGVKRAVLRSWSAGLRASVGSGRTATPGALHRVVVGRPVLAKLGLDAVRWLLVSGTPLSSEAVHFFQALGVDVTVGYGSAEVGGLALLGQRGDARADLPMTPMPGVQAEVVDEELRLRAPSIPPGVADADGWLATGDAAEQVGDGIVVRGRLADRLITADGPVVPQQVASRLRTSPYIREAVIVPEGGRVVALLEPSERSLSRWAAARRLRYTTTDSLYRLPEVVDLLRRAVDVAVQPLGTRIDDVRLLAAPLSVEAGTLTSTEKPVVGAVSGASVVDAPRPPDATQPTDTPSAAPAR